MIENAFGKLKGRFPLLKLMPGRMMERVYPLIEAMMILHNILMDLGDSPTEICDFDPNDDTAELVQGLLNDHGRAFDDTALRGQPDQDGYDADSLRDSGRVYRDAIMEAMGL